ncbi:MAG: hypothetical protein KDK07_24745 [Bauldia sp.]|nr:hypothetical protein [Bauldia sp.]
MSTPLEAILKAIESAVPPPPEPIDLKEAGLSQRDALLAVCDAIEVWRSDEGETYATVRVGNHREHHAVGSRAFRDWMLGELARQYVNKGRPASATEGAVGDARMGLEARAHLSGVRKPAVLRVATRAERLYVDLGQPEWNAVEIDGEGWRCVVEAPVPILRTRRTSAFPVPKQSSDFSGLRRLLDRLSEDDFILLVAWCVGAFLDGVPYPILILGGEQGSGKSTMARLAQALTDPVNGDLLQPPGDDRDLIAAARNNRVLAFDNFSGIKADLADSLCRLATGSEIGGRALYSNHETATFSARRPMILNGIPDLAARGDLADRAIVLRLEAPAQRVTERDWARNVAAILPATLGAIFNAIATGMARLEQTPTPDLRMADFARFIVAAEPALPWPTGGFLAAYRRNRGQAIAALAEGDLVATAVRNFIESRETWTGRLSDLYETLSVTMSPEARRSGDWPGNARWFSDRLRRAAPTLKALGVGVVERRGGTGLTVNIGKIASLASLASSDDVGVPRDSDASDASDARFRVLTEAHPENASTETTGWSEVIP